jgi:hypothetical protein
MLRRYAAHVLRYTSPLGSSPTASTKRFSRLKVREFRNCGPTHFFDRVWRVGFGE